MAHDTPIDSCWNSIGVWGAEKPRCEKLSSVIHCRNCEVFHTAAHQVFNRSSTSQLDATSEITIGNTHSIVDDAPDSIIAFRLYSEWFALPTGHLVEVADISPIHRLPHRFGGLILGVTNIVGEIRLCFSLPYLLGLKKNNLEKSVGVNSIFGRYLVLQLDGEISVFPVDEISGISRVNLSTINKIPTDCNKKLQSLANGVIKQEDKNIYFIDIHLLAGLVKQKINE